jgi:hypothetical protein
VVQRYQSQFPAPPGEPPPSAETELIVEQLRSAGGALAVIAGLVGAIAVHVIFVGYFLPSLVSPNSVQLATAGGSDLIGFAVFFGLAGLAGRSLVRGGGRRR